VCVRKGEAEFSTISLLKIFSSLRALFAELVFVFVVAANWPFYFGWKSMSAVRFLLCVVLAAVWNSSAFQTTTTGMSVAPFSRLRVAAAPAPAMAVGMRGSLHRSSLLKPGILYPASTALQAKKSVDDLKDEEIRGKRYRYWRISFYSRQFINICYVGSL
jgi:hypothetical protein